VTSNRPYLIRALYEWILDNRHTPYLLINADKADVNVPRQFIEDGKIILNISPSAVQDLELGNEWVLFSARFSGNRFDIQVPVQAIMAVYARENGQGMIFPEEEDTAAGEKSPTADADTNKAGKPHLKVIK
jgi:stringent starvation protein B